MEESSAVVVGLVQQALRLREEKQQQVWISISGAPGSGKSYLSEQLRRVLPNSVVIPMDGFHFYKSHLSHMPDPELAFARRGAAWTFDAEKFVDTLKACHANKEGLFPSFDHAVGDPVEDDIAVSSSHEFVIVEGLYLLLSASPWNKVKDIVDLSVFVHADKDVLLSRLIGRHMACFNMTEEEAESRAVNNDIPNAVDIIKNKDRADFILDNNEYFHAI